MPTGQAQILRRMPPNALASPNMLPTTSRTSRDCPPGNTQCELKASISQCKLFLLSVVAAEENVGRSS